MDLDFGLLSPPIGLLEYPSKEEPIVRATYFQRLVNEFNQINIHPNPLKSLENDHAEILLLYGHLTYEQSISGLIDTHTEINKKRYILREKLRQLQIVVLEGPLVEIEEAYFSYTSFQEVRDFKARLDIPVADVENTGFLREIEQQYCRDYMKNYQSLMDQNRLGRIPVNAILHGPSRRIIKDYFSQVKTLVSRAGGQIVSVRKDVPTDDNDFGLEKRKKLISIQF